MFGPRALVCWPRYGTWRTASWIGPRCPGPESGQRFRRWFELAQGVAVAGRVDGPGGLLEQVLGPFVGQASAARLRAQVGLGRRAGRGGTSIGEEQRAAGPAGHEVGE